MNQEAPGQPRVDGLLVTKLRLPQVRAEVVARPRLLDRLARALSTPLTLVAAPAGFGKTTLLASWCASSAAPTGGTAWLSLDPGDDEPVRFFRYLVAALRGARPRAVARAARLMNMPHPPITAALETLLNDLAGRDEGPLIVALDDYHVVQKAAIHDAVGYLLEHLPPFVHLVILSRVDPPLRLGRLRGRGLLNEIRAEDLRFTADEAARFLNEAMGLDLPAQQVETLESRTEGWITALQLAAIRLAQPDLRGASAAGRFIDAFGANQRYVAEYLMEEVIGRQPQDVQEFLLATSVLEKLCASLCSEVTGRQEGDAQEMLEYLQRSNLFLVPLDDEARWYRYHHLFRDFLRGRLSRMQAEGLPALYRSASAWCQRAGYVDEAVTYAVQGGDPDLAGDLIERYADQMLCRSALLTVRSWLSSLPEPVVEKRAALSIYRAWVANLLSRSGDRDEIERCLQSAERAAAAAGDRGQQDWVAGHAATIRVYLLQAGARNAAGYQAVIRQARLAQELLPRDESAHGANDLNLGYALEGLGDAAGAYTAFDEGRRSGLRVGNDYLAASCLYHQARMLHAQGRLHAAAEMLTDALAGQKWLPLRDTVALPALGSLHVGLGCIRFEWNDLDAAERDLRRGLEALHYAGVHGAPEAGYLTLARLMRARANEEGARQALERAGRLGAAGQMLASALAAEWSFEESGGAASAMGRTGALAWAHEQTRHWAGAEDEDATGPGLNALGDARYFVFCTSQRLLLAAGEPGPVLPGLERAMAQAVHAGHGSRAVELLVLQALALNLLGENRRAFEALARALAAAEPEGHVRSFDQGPGVRGLLAGAAERGIARAYVQRIQAVLGWEPEAGRPAAEAVGPLPPVTAHGAPGEDAPVEGLTEREQEILELIALGLSNADIAARLYIEVSTVKRHMNHLLGKLGAVNRVQAVARGRALGLLR